MSEKISRWQWVKETPVAILEENELPAWKTASQVLQAVQAMGAGMLRYPAIRWALHSFDESKHLPKYPGLGERDLFGEISREMRANGIKLMAYCHYGVIHTHAAKIHDDWVARGPQNEPLSWNGNHFKVCMCNDAFVLAMREAIREMCEKYRPDALYIDGPGWYCETCYCQSCRASYRQLHGDPMPDSISWSDGSRLKYNVLRDQVLVRWASDLRERLNDFPDLPILFNMCLPYIPDHRRGVSERLCETLDGGNSTEVHRPGMLWQMSETVRLAESLNKVSLAYMPPGPYETLRTFDSAEMDVFNFLYLMHGATGMLGTVSSYLNDQTGARRMHAWLDYARAHRAVYYRAKPLADVGLLYAKTLADFSAGEKVNNWRPYFSGAFRALLHEHVDFQAMSDEMLTNDMLNGLKAIYIPDGACLRDSTLDMLRKYVSAGGNLLATGSFSLLDEHGTPRANFGAADLLGVDFISHQPADHYRGREYRETGPLHGYSLVPEAYLRLTDERLRQSVTASKNGLVPVSDAVVGIPDLERLIEYCLVKPRAGVETLADLYLPAGGAFGRTLDFPLGTPPGITLNRYGKGRVIYVAAPIEKHYFVRGLPESRRLIATLVDRLLDNDPLVRLKAPAGVIIHLTRGPEGIYLHLLNYCGTMYECGWPVEWLAPIRDLEVELSARLGPIREIRALNGETPVPFERRNNRCVFRIPVLNAYATYVIR